MQVIASSCLALKTMSLCAKYSQNIYLAFPHQCKKGDLTFNLSKTERGVCLLLSIPVPPFCLRHPHLNVSAPFSSNPKREFFPSFPHPSESTQCEVYPVSFYFLCYPHSQTYYVPSQGLLCCSLCKGSPCLGSCPGPTVPHTATCRHCSGKVPWKLRLPS